MSLHALYLLTGGNQGNRQALLHQARERIGQSLGSAQALASPVYETEPWGHFAEAHPQPFLNQALLVHTPLSPFEALEATQQIEQELGRIRPKADGYTSRPIDIDLLIYDQLVMDTPRLILPHPRMHLRRFVLEPLCDIAPDLLHPVLHKTIRELLAELND